MDSFPKFSQHPYDVDVFIVSFLGIKTIKWFVQGHTAEQQWSQDLNPGVWLRAPSYNREARGPGG